MTPRVLALTVTVVVALAAVASASAGGGPLLPRSSGELLPSATATWDTTHTYGVNGTKRTCTLTRGAKCVGARLRGR